MIKITKKLDFSDLEDSASLKPNFNLKEFNNSIEIISDSIRDLVFEECIKQNLNPNSAKYFFSINLTIEGNKEILKDIEK